MCTLAVAYLDPGIQEWRLRLFWYLEPVGTCSRFGTCEIKDLPWWDDPNWLARFIETRLRSAFLYSLKSRFVSSYVSLASSGSEDSDTLFFTLVWTKVRIFWSWSFANINQGNGFEGNNLKWKQRQDIYSCFYELITRISYNYQFFRLPYISNPLLKHSSSTSFPLGTTCEVLFDGIL